MFGLERSEGCAGVRLQLAVAGFFRLQVQFQTIDLLLQRLFVARMCGRLSSQVAYFCLALREFVFGFL